MVVGQDVSVSVQNPVYRFVGFQSCQVVIEGQMPDFLQQRSFVAEFSTHFELAMGDLATCHSWEMNEESRK